MRHSLKIAAVAATMALMFCSCGSSSSDVTSSELLTAAADSGAKFEEMVSVEESDIKFLYDIEKDWYKEFSASAAGNPAYADEIVVIKASSSDNATKIKEALEKRVESRKNTLQSYAPDEYDKLCDSQIKTDGDYIYLIVGKDNKTAEKALKKLL